MLKRKQNKTHLKRKKTKFLNYWGLPISMLFESGSLKLTYDKYVELHGNV